MKTTMGGLFKMTTLVYIIITTNEDNQLASYVLKIKWRRAMYDKECTCMC